MVIPLFAQTDTPQVPLEDVVGKGLTTSDYVVAGVVFVALIVAGVVLGRLVTRFLERRDADHTMAVFVGRGIRNLLVLAAFVYALILLDVRVGPLLGALGIVAIALAFGAQAIFQNFFASVVLRTRRPIRRGDQITTQDVSGTVTDVNFRTVVLTTYDGERVVIPCSEVINGPLTNHTIRGERRTTLTVGVHYRTDLEQAQSVLLEAVRSVEGVRRSPAPEAWVVGFGDSSIDFEVRFWHRPDIASLYEVRSSVAMAAKAALDRAAIEIPFPQRVLTFAPGSDGEPASDGGAGRSRRSVSESP